MPSRINCFLFCCLLLVMHISTASTPEKELVIKGRKTFNDHCSVCHAFGKELVGPSLASVTEKRSEEWLINFITHSQDLIVSGDSQAVLLYKNYNYNVMPSFSNLSKEEIHALLVFIKNNSVFPSVDQGNHEANKENNGVSGKVLFQTQCGRCHALDRQLVGPALGSTPKTRPTQWLYRFIKSPEKMLTQGDPYTHFLYRKFNKFLMPDFDYLSKDQIQTILSYIEQASKSPNYISGVNGLKKRGDQVVVSGAQQSKDPYEEEKNIHTGLGFKITMGSGTLLSLCLLAGIIVLMYKRLS